jgi:hypothetical protein
MSKRVDMTSNGSPLRNEIVEINSGDTYSPEVSEHTSDRDFIDDSPVDVTDIKSDVEMKDFSDIDDFWQEELMMMYRMIRKIEKKLDRLDKSFETLVSKIKK